jgi:integrase
MYRPKSCAIVKGDQTMSVKIRPYRNGGYEVDITVTLPDGTRHRERRKAPVASKSAARHWGRDRERELCIHGPVPKRGRVPTLSDFAPRFLNGYAVANRQKPSGIVAKETILRLHLDPLFGAKRLDKIGNEDIQRLKSRLKGMAPKTVNNVLSVLNTLLKIAVEWGVIDRMPCTIRLLNMPPPKEAAFHDFDEYAGLIEAAKELDWRAHLIVLLGGDAGLRCGEMMALEWTDLSTDKKSLCVNHSEWRGQVTAPKGNRHRILPLTGRLREALRCYRHLRSERVLCQDDRKPLTQKMIQVWVRRAARLAGLKNGGVHILRHTFCSHLTMRGVPPRTVQELAGHKDLATTSMYMHLSPRASVDGIRALENPNPGPVFGEILETDGEEKTN